MNWETRLRSFEFRISSGNHKQSFPMKHGVLTSKWVKLLLSFGHSCYRPRRDGERKRKSVRGCITSPDLSVMSLVSVKQGAHDIPGLTDSSIPNRLGPKRANHIRKFWVRFYEICARISLCVCTWCSNISPMILAPLCWLTFFFCLKKFLARIHKELGQERWRTQICDPSYRPS